jgi:chromosome segregation ATPase
VHLKISYRKARGPTAAEGGSPGARQKSTRFNVTLSRVLQSRIDKFQEIVSWFTLLERDFEGSVSLIESLESLRKLVVSLEEERCEEEWSLANRLFATEVQIATDVLRAESLLFGLDNRQDPSVDVKSALVDMEEQNQGLREDIKRIGAENEKNVKEAHTMAASAHVPSKSNSELVQHNLELESENKQLKSARNEMVDKAVLFRLQQEVAAAGEETKAAKKEIERLKEEHMVQKRLTEMEAKELQGNLERQKSACQRAQNISKSLEEEIEVLKTETKRQSSELVRAKTEAKAQAEAQAAIQTAVDTTRSELARESADAGTLRVELARARDQLESLRFEATNAKADAQASKEWAESKAKHAAEAEQALSTTRAQLEKASALVFESLSNSESSRAEALNARIVTEQSASESQLRQREIDRLNAKLDSLEESKREQDKEVSHLRSQSIGAQARIKSLEFRESALTAEIKAVGEIKVGVMMITSDMRDLAHRAHSEKNQMENRISEAERSAKFWKQEAESAQQALDLMKHGDIVKDSISDMKTSMEKTRSELARTQEDLKKSLAQSEEECLAKDKLLKEKSTRIRKLEKQISDLQEQSRRIQEDLSKSVAGKGIRDHKQDVKCLLSVGPRWCSCSPLELGCTEIEAQRAELSVQKQETLLLQKRYEEERAQVNTLRNHLDAAKSSLAAETHAARSGVLRASP